MKKAKPKSTERCSYCMMRAEWRSSGATLNKYACTEHQVDLQKYEADNRDDGYMSEADYQTWGRF